MASVQATPDMSGQAQGQAQGQGQLPANLTKEQVAQILQVLSPSHTLTYARRNSHRAA